MKTYVVLLASGSGSRFGGDVPKQFVEIRGRMVIEYTLDVCMAASSVDEVVVVVSECFKALMESVLAKRKDPKPVRVVLGGNTRMQSTQNGVKSIESIEANVLIHNAVQPFVTAETFDACVLALDQHEAVTVGSPSVYTVLELDDNRVLRRVVDRSHSVNDLGPECFRLSFLKKVFGVAGADVSFTNITGMVLKYQLGEVYVVDGDPGNIKITYPQDLVLARMILEAQAAKGGLRV